MQTYKRRKALKPSKEKIKDFRKSYCPLPALIFFVLAFISAAVHIISVFSESFSDFINRYIGSVVRGIITSITNILPFSLIETLIIFIPVLFVSVMLLAIGATRKSTRHGVRFLTGLTSVLTLFYSVYVFSAAVSYNGTPISKKLGFSEEKVTVEGLSAAAMYTVEKMNDELDSIEFIYKDRSVMPYTLGELNTHLLGAYDTAADKYSFIPRLKSKIKPVALSEAMTYTHISGLYSYYTGEVNLNINFPDYTLPFTAAHELAHQRGIIREDEANFAAFLVCIGSDEPYIRYSGYLGMYEYLLTALRSADYGEFAKAYTALDPRVRSEISAYNSFFEKYRSNKAAKVTSAVNDTYLKIQGVKEGEQSYGMAVELAVAYVASLEE